MKSILRLPILTALVLVVLSLGLQLNAQYQSSPQQSPSQQPQAQPPSQSSSPNPQPQADPGAQSSPSDHQVFTGTIMKSGDKYVLQAEDGKTYDIDRQDLAANHVGKAVRVPGTLDPNGKLIHVH